MLKVRLLFLMICFILFTTYSETAFADATATVKTKNLSLDEAVKLALSHYSSVKLANWRAVESNAQFSYINAVKKKLEDKNVTSSNGQLPVSFNDFLKNISNYDQLSDEEKAAIQQSIVLQIMINTSINQWIQAQNVSQNSYNLELKNSQLKEYSDQLRSLESNQSLNRLEVEESEALVRYDVIQKYYLLSSAIMNIEYLKQDLQYLASQADDAHSLYKSGLISKKELEETQARAEQQEIALNREESSLQAQMELFKHELGLTDFSKVIINPPALPVIPTTKNFNTVFDPVNNLELKQQDVKVKLAKDNYDAILISEPELKSYYYILWSSQLEQRNALQQQLEEKFTGYKAEANKLSQRNVQLKAEYIRLMQALDDIKTLQGKGLATLSEVDTAIRQVNQSNQQMNSLQYEYLIFLEKVNLIAYGVLI